MKKFQTKINSGFTLAEVVISVGIISLVLVAIYSFQADIFSLNRVVQSGLLNQQEAKKLVRPFANEVRGSIESAQGAYPIASAGTSSISFFTDLDGDGLAERVRYFLEDGDFKKGITEPDPVTYWYDEQEEQVIRVIHDVVDKNIFYYYDSNYDGTASSTELSHPVTPNDIRMIKVIVEIDSNPDKPPAPFVVTTQVSMRNLKDNL